LLTFGIHTGRCQSVPAFSEDFESGQLDKSVWTELVQGDATLKIQSDKAAHGKYSLMVHYPANAARSLAFILHGPLPEALKQRHFGRVYVLVTPPLPQNHTVMIPVGDGDYPLSKFQEIGESRGTWQPSYQQNRFQVGRGETVKHAGEIPKDKWFCLEWEFNDDPNSYVLWVDGEKVDENRLPFKDETKNLVGGFVQAGFGLRVWGPVTEAFDVYYDDIALDAKRIGTLK